MDSRKKLEKRFEYSGKLTKRKLLEYLPAMLINNLSTLLLLTVDGIVVGNLVGSKALSSVNIVYPATVFIGVISELLSAGVATRLSHQMGQIDFKGLLRAKATSKLIMVIGAVFISVIQIPLVAIIIKSYHLSPEMNKLVWSYTIGMMICSPFGLISTIGALQLQIVGKMKALTLLGIVEGVVNLLLDLLFVGPLKMGVAGAGLGTAGANFIRCTLTLIYLIKGTDMYYSGDEKPSFTEARSILSHGLPDAANSFMMAIQNYAIMSIILAAFGEDGGVIKGVCTFSYGLAFVLVYGVRSSMRPLAGLLSGAEDLMGLRLLMRQASIISILLNGALFIFVESAPGLIYSLHGVKQIPKGGIMSLRIYFLYILFYSIDTLFRLYFTNRKLIQSTTILTLAGNALLILFAFILSRIFAPEWIWLCYLLSETVIFAVNIIRYRKQLNKDRTQMEEAVNLHLTVTPKDAVEASRMIIAFAEEQKLNKKRAFRIAVCVEEMAAYAQKNKKGSDLSIQVIIRFFKDSAMLMIIDDGKCIFLDEEEEERELITSNYGLLKKLAKSVQYQYVLNLNYTVCRY